MSSNDDTTKRFGRLLVDLRQHDGDLHAVEDAYAHDVLDAVYATSCDIGERKVRRRLENCGAPFHLAKKYLKSAGLHASGRLPFYSPDDLANLPPVEFMADGLIEDKGLAMLFGETGCGKTFLALDLAMSMTYGGRWLDSIEVKHGPVIYIAAEGWSGIRTRMEAWKQARDITEPTHPFRVIPRPVNLGEKHEVDRFIEEATARLPDGAGMVVFDTLARCTVGVEENGSGMNEVHDHAGRIQRALDTTLLLIHHEGKDASRGARGWSGNKAALDSQLRLSSGAITRLWNTKQKNGPEADPITVQMPQVGPSLVPTASGSASDGLDESKVQEIHEVLTKADEELSQKQVTDAVTGKSSTIREHLDTLAADPESVVHMERDGNGKWFSIRRDEEGRWDTKPTSVTTQDEDEMKEAA